MHNLSARYLMQIHVKTEKSYKPINDYLTRKMEKLLERAKMGRPYKGTHKCKCGKRSMNCDLYINGYITNSLAAHYLRWHRGDVPQLELRKLKAI